MSWKLILLHQLLLLIWVKKLRGILLVSVLWDSVELSFFINNHWTKIVLKEPLLTLHKNWSILDSMWLIAKIMSYWLIYHWIAQMPMIFLQLCYGVHKCTREFAFIPICNKVVILKSGFDVKNSYLRSRSRPGRHILCIFIFGVKITILVRNLCPFSLLLFWSFFLE